MFYLWYVYTLIGKCTWLVLSTIFDDEGLLIVTGSDITLQMS